MSQPVAGRAQMARRWPSISLELGLLWPRFTRIAGGTIGLPFSLEGFAFFVEAIFLGLYLYGRDRLCATACVDPGRGSRVPGLAEG